MKLAGTPWGKESSGWHVKMLCSRHGSLRALIDITVSEQEPQRSLTTKTKSRKVDQKQVNFANYWMHNAFVTMGEEDE